ncbi:uncharacterized protein LOC116106617 isoform X2 [Pistacia vera]|uniref:uncharacterized protein LOC116106617 isoform X2 n=1 Tax=Pistacia vera TaxID=55513 RepID=UPI0012639A8F|nr:uncharacterized protein LOC116106617 isoform X2 [Pistacia vera]
MGNGLVLILFLMLLSSIWVIKSRHNITFIMSLIFTEVKVVVVFDAMLSGLPTQKESFGRIDIVFCGETCADSWIEKEIVALKEDGWPSVWVVTSDHCHRHAAHGGAFVWSCKALVSEKWEKAAV